MNSNRIFWISGVLVALAGAAMVRLLPEALVGFRASGFAMAGLGLFIVALGVRHRIDSGQ